MRRALGWALVVALAAACALLAGSSPRADAQAPLPDCAPGTPPLPVPVVKVEADPGNAGRIVAGRFFTIEYDDPALTVAVQNTVLPPGAVIDGTDDGNFITLALPAAGAIPLTAKYYDLEHNGTCVQSLTYTVNVEAGDLVPAGIGATEGGGPTFKKLPKVGINTGGLPSVGLSWLCTGTQAVVPVSAVLREERVLRKRPSVTSKTLRIDLPDPCSTKSVTVTSPGVVMRFLAFRYVDEGDRVISVEHRARHGRRYWLQILQGTRVLGSLRYYVAWRPQNLSRPAAWVVAPEAAFEKARCKRPRAFEAPLGLHKYPLPPCVRHK
jgi:hypothetical protein